MTIQWARAARPTPGLRTTGCSSLAGQQAPAIADRAIADNVTKLVVRLRAAALWGMTIQWARAARPTPGRVTIQWKTAARPNPRPPPEGRQRERPLPRPPPPSPPLPPSGPLAATQRCGAPSGRGALWPLGAWHRRPWAPPRMPPCATWPTSQRSASGSGDSITDKKLSKEEQANGRVGPGWCAKGKGSCVGGAMGRESRAMWRDGGLMGHGMTEGSRRQRPENAGEGLPLVWRVWRALREPVELQARGLRREGPRVLTPDGRVLGAVHRIGPRGLKATCRLHAAGGCNLFISVRAGWIREELEADLVAWLGQARDPARCPSGVHAERARRIKVARGIKVKPPRAQPHTTQATALP